MANKLEQAKTFSSNEDSNELSIYKRVLFYILGSVIVVVVFFSVIEFATRTVSWISGKGFTLQLHELDPLDNRITNLYTWHPFTGFIMSPGISFVGGHPNVKKKPTNNVNTHGFLAKDNDLTFKKPADEIRVAVIGASTSANIHLSYDENWPGRLENLLQQQYTDKKIRIINAGVPGFTTAQSIGNLSLRVMPFKPDVVIIYHAYNDFKAIRLGEFKPDYSHIHTSPYGYKKLPPFYIRWLNNSMMYVRARNSYREYQKLKKSTPTNNQKQQLQEIPKVAQDVFAQHIRAMVDVARGGNAKVILSSFATLHDTQQEYNTQFVVDSLSSLQKKELGALQHFSGDLSINAIMMGFVTYNNILKSIAEELHLGWVDNASLVPHEDKYFVDRVHFTAEGAEKMANNYFPVVMQQLQKK